MKVQNEYSIKWRGAATCSEGEEKLIERRRENGFTQKLQKLSQGAVFFMERTW